MQFLIHMTIIKFMGEETSLEPGKHLNPFRVATLFHMLHVYVHTKFNGIFCLPQDLHFTSTK